MGQVVGVRAGLLKMLTAGSEGLVTHGEGMGARPLSRDLGPKKHYRSSGERGPEVCGTKGLPREDSI